MLPSTPKRCGKRLCWFWIGRLFRVPLAAFSAVSSWDQWIHQNSRKHAKEAMSRRKEILRTLATLCDEPRLGDGQDPRYDRKRQRNANGERKTWQLCKQIAIAVQLALGNSADERLRELSVVEVTPAPDASRLLLLVQPNSAVASCEEEMNEALANARGYLRTAAAEAITRKKTPILTVRFLPVGPHQEGSP